MGMTARKMPLLLLLSLAALALGWLMPGHYYPWSTFQQQWIAGLGGVMLAASAFLPVGDQMNVRLSFRWSRLALLALFLAIVPWIQWGLGQVVFLTDAIVPSLFLAAFACSLTIGSALAEKHGEVWRGALMIAILIAAFISVGIALAQWLQVGESLYVTGLPLDGRAYANLAQPNHLVTLLGMGVGATLYFFETRRVSGATASLLVGWLGLGMLTTQSRTAWMFVALVVLWWACFRRKVDLLLPPTVVTVGAASFSVGVFLWPYMSAWLDLAPASLYGRLVAHGRLTIWQIMCDAIGRAPWLGYGWNQVTLAQQAAALDNPTQGEMFQNSHNFALDVFAWMGVPLGCVVLVAVAVWLIRAIRGVRSSSQWSLLVPVGAIWAHAMLEFPLDYLYFVVPLGLLMGTVQFREGGAAAPLGTSHRALSVWGLAALSAVLTGLLFLIGAEYMRVEESVRQQRFLLAGIGVDRVKSVPPPDVVLLDVPREYHRFWSTPVARGMSAATLDWMRHVTQRTASPPAMLRYALAAGLNGRAAEAERTLRLICKMHSPARCIEGKKSWEVARAKYPELATMPWPAVASDTGS
ncbi:MAG: O-antigen ligase C-terminal domain-containing protein [Ideonella sp.]|nr:O-antigen ligase C-terminal domain-containing protein [Ideonella sp.]MCC7455943.1 O-antigen ligase C-terminal domain-containing protein [Nitrospira sp.]